MSRALPSGKIRQQSANAPAKIHLETPTDGVEHEPNGGSFGGRAVEFHDLPERLFLKLSCVNENELKRRKAEVEEIHSEDFMQTSYEKARAFLAKNLAQVKAKMRENNTEYTDERAEEILLANYAVKKVCGTKIITYVPEEGGKMVCVPMEAVQGSNVNIDVSTKVAMYVSTFPDLGKEDSQLIDDGIVREVKSITIHGLDELFIETSRVHSLYNASNWNDSGLLGNNDKLKRVAKFCAHACVEYSAAEKQVKDACEKSAQVFGNSANPREGQGDELDIEAIDWNI
ncbi:MAG: hypothetical protein LBB15_01075 [Puniceicoccales bacterium]|jgi:hypothetical protein|nr:hypothetical protein [Puniceicoccales bacterium]